jgi:drug/metabolite transporter (DMT)-like permease
MAWAFLGEAVSPVQAAAMAVVIGALAIVVRSQATPAPAAAPVASATIDEHRDTAH